MNYLKATSLLLCAGLCGTVLLTRSANAQESRHVATMPAATASRVDQIAQTAALVIVAPFDALNRRVAFTIRHPDVVGARMAEPFVEAGAVIGPALWQRRRAAAFVAGCGAALMLKGPGDCEVWGALGTRLLEALEADREPAQSR